MWPTAGLFRLAATTRGSVSRRRDAELRRGWFSAGEQPFADDRQPGASCACENEVPTRSPSNTLSSFSRDRCCSPICEARRQCRQAPERAVERPHEIRPLREMRLRTWCHEHRAEKAHPRLDGPPGFDLAGTVYSHGWCMLAPNRRIAKRDPGTGLGGRWRRGADPVTPAAWTRWRGRDGGLAGRGSPMGLTRRHGRRRRDVRHMLRGRGPLRLPRRCRMAGPPFDRVAAHDFGRLSPSPTLFEDVCQVLAQQHDLVGTIAMVAAVEIAGSGSFPGRRESRRWGPRRSGTAPAGATGPRISRARRGGGERELDPSLGAMWRDRPRPRAEDPALFPASPLRGRSGLTPARAIRRIGVDTVFRCS